MTMTLLYAMVADADADATTAWHDGNDPMHVLDPLRRIWLVLRQNSGKSSI